MLQTGDILFSGGSSPVSKIIRGITFGEASHVGLIYDHKTIFETDGRWGKAEFHNISQYEGKNIEIFRRRSITEAQKDHIKLLCQDLEGTPYSYWDIIIKGAFFWLHPKLRGKLAKLLGNKKFMICNELVMSIMYQTTQDSVFKDTESSNPSELRASLISRPLSFARIF